jgi:hypothetical protein
MFPRTQLFRIIKIIIPSSITGMNEQVNEITNEKQFKEEKHFLIVFLSLLLLETD